MKIIGKGIPKSLCCVSILIDLLFTAYMEMLVVGCWFYQKNEFRLIEWKICGVAPGGYGIGNIFWIINWLETFSISGKYEWNHEVDTLRKIINEHDKYQRTQGTASDTLEIMLQYSDVELPM